MAIRMNESGKGDPLHGVTLEAIVTALVERHGWEVLGREIPIRCFTHDPSIKSSLTFLRRTPWARARVEELYLRAKAPPGRLASPPLAAQLALTAALRMTRGSEHRWGGCTQR
jgi:uncharacterized protein (DUF2132 family)